MDTDPQSESLISASAETRGAARQSGEQTTLHDGPLAVFMSWLRLGAPAHENPILSKAEGPVSGSEDEKVEELTLAQWTRGVGKIADGGIQ